MLNLPQPAARPTAASSGTSNAQPSSATELKKGSWKEIMARAAAAKDMKIPVAGTIVHKPKPQAEKQKKEWQKKLAEQRAAKADGKAPAAPEKAPANGKAAPIKGKAPIEPAKAGRRDLPLKSPALEKSKYSEPAPKRKLSERPPSPKRVKKESYSRYRYAEDYSDYSDESDMEATGFDILAEEERSTRNAVKEDLEQEKLEAEMRARKAAMKKGIKR